MLKVKNKLVGRIKTKSSLKGKLNNTVVYIKPSLENLEATPTKTQQTFNHESSYGYDEVVVNPIPEEYIIPEGTLPITENATYDVTNYARVSASVYPVPNLQDKEVTPTKEVQNITSDENYDGLNQVTVNAIPNEYIVPSGSLDITENGTKDVTSYAEVNVNIEIPEPTLQDKSITINENGIQNIVADEGYDALSSVEVITNVASSVGSSNSLNVFTQETEPETKDGIWLQTDKTYTKVASEEYNYNTNWDIEFTRATLPYRFAIGGGAKIGDNIYMFGGVGGATTAYKYNIPTDTYTQLPDMPIPLSQGSCTIAGDEIYFGGDPTSYARFAKYNTISNTYTTLANPPYTLYGAKLIAIGNYIYAIGNIYNRSYSTKIYKYNINANSWSTLSVSSPQYFAMAYPFAIGTDIYCVAMRTWLTSSTVGPSPKAYKFNTITEVFTELNTPPTDFYSTSACVDGDNVYLFGSDLADYELINYRYNISTDTYTRMEDLPHSVRSSGTAVKYQDEFMIVGGGGVEDNSYSIMSLYQPQQEPNTYNEDVVILFENTKPVETDVKTKLFNTDKLINFNNFVSYYFKDAIYQSKDGTNDTTIPTYYGDGTQWIKYKN